MRWLARFLISSSFVAVLGATRPALAAIGALKSPSSDSAQSAVIHVVQPGENLFRIGLAYGIGWQAIMAANGLYSTSIYVGESLVIPVAGAGTAPAAPAPAPANTQGSYMIQRGDTLWLIAQRFGLSVGQMMAANGIRNPNYIYYGQVLVIPGQEGPAAQLEGKALSVAGRAQALPLDCESRSAVDWAAYFGTEIGELDFLSQLPTSDDPDVGFVGNAHGALGQTPPNDYGVHAKPVAALLRGYGVSARAARGLSWDEVRAEIDANRPVITWVVSQVGYGTPVEYTAASTGRTTTVVPFEHTVIVIGYGQDTVTLMDGGTAYTRSLEQFMASWGALGDMAVLWGSA